AVHTTDVGVQRMLSLATGTARPTQAQFRLALAQAESLNRFGHEPSALGPVEGLCRVLQQGPHRRRQFHWPPPAWGSGYCTDFHLANYFPVIALAAARSAAGAAPAPIRSLALSAALPCCPVQAGQQLELEE